jgi:hypothetical protein
VNSFPSRDVPTSPSKGHVTDPTGRVLSFNVSVDVERIGTEESMGSSRPKERRFLFLIPEIAT